LYVITEYSLLLLIDLTNGIYEHLLSCTVRFVSAKDISRLDVCGVCVDFEREWARRRAAGQRTSERGEDTNDTTWIPVNHSLVFHASLLKPLDYFLRKL